MSLYDILRAILRSLGPTPGRIAQSLFQLGVAAVLLVLVLAAVGMEFSSSPRFCVTCHFMRPYYESWQKSAHNQVPCIDCHFPPGLNFELERKFKALVQVVKYVTRQYGTRPWTQVEDSSCLRPGCHQTRLLAGKVDFKGVQFDHLPHLTGFRRVTRLRCTSCHSQIVQGQHMTVTEGTCFLCHFKHGTGGGEPADCKLCHKFPLPTQGGLDHSFVEKRGVDCQECHVDVVHGEGEVPRDRCLLCHSEPERLQRYSDVAFVHENHVTERKIECTQCHNTVEHYRPPESDYLSKSRSDLCGLCHHDEHNQVAQFYAGQGAADVAGEPAPMSKAGVTCQACHRSYETSAGTSASHAGAGGCMLCHGESYGADLARWRAEFGAPVAQLTAALRKARELIEGTPASQTARPSAWGLVDKAVKNAEFVQQARGLHNPEYARKILGTSALEANEALRMVGLSYRVPQPPSAAAAVSGACMTCHTQVPAQTWTIYGVAFDHGLHASQSGTDCSYCHQAALPEQPGHGRVALGPEDCQACHAGRIRSPHPSRWQQQHGAQAQAQRQSCNVCHDANSCARCHGLSMPHPQNWQAVHGQSALQRSDVCDQCHKQSMCTSCHGTVLPHPGDWTQKHGPTYRGNQQLCWRCHTGQNCAQCHGVVMPHPSNWQDLHGKSATRAPAQCATCHQTKDCLACHQGNPPPSHLQDWAQQHPQVGQKEPDLCGLCHPGNKGDTCLTCHGLPMPHPDDFALEHAKLASFDKQAVCFRCHDLQKTCGECHENAGQ